jgi:hypothetical protein
MKKVIFSLPLVMPLGAVLSAPAGAHNGKCCVPSRPAEQPPNSAFLDPIKKTCPQDMITYPQDADCSESPVASDFCTRASLKNDINPDRQLAVWGYVPNEDKTFCISFLSRSGMGRVIKECARGSVDFCQPKKK